MNQEAKEGYAREVANGSSLHGLSGQEQYDLYLELGGGRVRVKSPEGKAAIIEASDHRKAENN